MGNDLRGQLSQVGPPAEGVIGDLPMAKNKQRPIILAILGVLISVGGYAVVAGKDRTPDPAALGMKAADEQPARGLPPAPLVAPLAASQPQVTASAVQAAPPVTQQVAPLIRASVPTADAQVRNEVIPLALSNAKVAPTATHFGIQKPVAIAARPVARVKAPAASIDQIGITEE